MKIAIRGGHSLDIRGANGIVDEVIEDRKITSKVIEYLKLMGNEVLDVTPSNSKTSSNDLTGSVRKANEWKADYFVSIHLNAFNKMAHGTEVLYKSDKGKFYADRIVSKLASLGFYNRGSKLDSRGLYEFKACAMPNNIIEGFFVDNKEDVDLYNKLGVDIIAKAIAEGIIGKEIKEKVVSPTLSQEKVNKPKVNYCLAWQKWYNEQTKTTTPLVIDGIYGSGTQKSIDSLLIYIKQSKKFKYCHEFQRFYNQVTETSKPISEDGIWGNSTEKAYTIMNDLIKKF